MQKLILLTAILFCSLTAKAGQNGFILHPELGDWPWIVTHVSSKENGVNQVQMLNSGIASLQKRLDMIKKAKSEILIEYFIYEEDTSGNLLINALAEAAKRGVRVRMILDNSITVVEMNEYFAKFMKERGIEVAHHRRALDPLTAQYRTHRKIFAIDTEEGKEVITGGRNIGDDYFDLDPEYNFLDRDIWVKGPIVQAVWDSYEAYWNHRVVKVSEEPKATHNANSLFRSSSSNRNRARYERARTTQHLRLLEEARSFVYKTEGVEELTKNIERVARPILEASPVRICPRITFASDKAGGAIKHNLSKKAYRKRYKILRKELHRRFMDESETGNEVMLVSPYFILNKQWNENLKYMLDKGKKVSVFTNSLNSTDAFYVAAAFYREVRPHEIKGLIPYIHNAKYLPLTDVVEEKIKDVRWGVHSKTFIFDNDSFYVGTYNIDNRSDFYNAEMGFFCDGSTTLTNELKESINSRLETTYIITGKDSAVDQNGNPADIYGDAPKDYIKNMKLMKLPAWIFEDLL